MPTSNLSSEAAKELLDFQKELRRFLKQFEKLEKGGAERSQYLSNARNAKDLYLALDFLDLKDIVKSAKKKVVDEVEENGDEAPKTKKEERKARREARKKARKDNREKRRAERRVKSVERKKQSKDKSGAKEESQFRYDSLKALWDAYKFDEITSDFRDYLDKGEQFLTDAQNFIDFAQTFAPGIYIKEIEEIEELIEKAQSFLAVARNVSKQVDRYAKLAQDVVNITLSLPSKAEDLKDGIVEEATKIFAAAKSFIATADVTDDEIELNVETLQKYLARGEEKLGKLEVLLGAVIGDEDGDNLPDWYNRLEAKFNELLGDSTDLIPGTKIDDKLLIQITGLKRSVDQFIAAASDKVEELGLKEKIQNAQQWLGKLSEFTQAITGFVENVKEGDLANIYEDLKDFKNFIDSDEDILKGTDIDDKIKKKLQEHSEKARTWLMNKLTGGDASKEGEVREILGAIDKIILSTGGVVDHSSKYEKDKNRITIPNITDVATNVMRNVLAQYGIRKKDASFEGILSDMKDQADDVKAAVGHKFKDAVTRGAQASDAFRDAKDEYDQAVKKHNDYFKATNTLAKKIINGLLSVAGVAANSFAPGSGSIINAVGAALLGEFDAVNDQIDDLMPDGLEFIGDLAKDVLPGVLPQWGSERGIIQIEGKELLEGLNELYINGVSSRYQEVISILNLMKAKSRNLGKNLRSLEQAETVDQEALEAIKKKVIILELKWSGLKKDVKKKYIDLPFPPINQQKAYHNASRYLYSVWLIRFPKKEIRIANAMIDQLEKFGIMSEAKAEWDTGFWAGVGRGFFGFFGGDPFDYRGELKKMKRWAAKESDALKSTKAWAEVF
ncbi:MULTISPECIES: hypothetical protein [unclassified Aureispira]|uniref:hypothetical protein n=1 Tax=unclassified Aureispira TaxID=2649989 RepID=UPI000695FC32|nr:MULTISPECIES: hypothetical protein [unclassified Aureispira]WMX16775.1 hypothetical protein QP953_10380 [Aureispira sp. CCB-E]